MLSVISYNGFSLRTGVEKLNVEVIDIGDVKINALSSIELADVDVFNGDFEVTTGGSILARDVMIATDSYAN
jgi:hypothetical protein